jgi:hypothetical protein
MYVRLLQLPIGGIERTKVALGEVFQSYTDKGFCRETLSVRSNSGINRHTAGDADLFALSRRDDDCIFG